MKHLTWAVPAFLLGMVLGALGPRSDLRKAREDLRVLREESTARDHAREEILRAKSLLGVSDAEIRHRAAARSTRPEESTSTSSQ